MYRDLLGLLLRVRLARLLQLLLIVTISVLTPLRASAETLYVTDVLRLELHSSPESDGRALKILLSGDALEILDRSSLHALVRTEEGLEGWVKANYLVADKPALTQLRDVTQERDILSTELGALRDESRNSDTELQQLRNEKNEWLQQAQVSSDEISALRNSNQTLSDAAKAKKFDIPIVWALLMSAITLLAGFAGGWWWTDARQRARHGGYRI